MTVERISGNRTGRRITPAVYERKPEPAPSAILPDAETPSLAGATMVSLMREVEILRRDLQTARDRLEEVERVADQDQLLPVLNRRAFLRELTRQIGVTARYGTQASLVYFDLDGFKRIN